jgi:hypothetical protein
VTWGFLYLLLFLGGFTLALVTGLVRRILHPSELCGDSVVAPSHEHWQAAHAPRTDALVAFATVFGVVTLAVHGLTSTDPAREIAIGAIAGLVGAVALRAWMRHVCHPLGNIGGSADQATVIRDIPAAGFGTVEISVGNVRAMLAARSADGVAIRSGTQVELIESADSVAVVRPRPG